MGYRHTMRLFGIGNCPLLLVLVLLCFLVDVECLGDVSGSRLRSTAYEWGLFGGYPRQDFKSSALRPPRMNTVQWDEQCARGYTLLTLRGTSVTKPTAVILHGTGELVWMDENFGYIMNLKIQQYKGKQYLTFWSGEFGAGFGEGTYYMVRANTSACEAIESSLIRFVLARLTLSDIQAVLYGRHQR